MSLIHKINKCRFLRLESLKIQTAVLFCIVIIFIFIEFHKTKPTTTIFTRRQSGDYHTQTQSFSSSGSFALGAKRRSLKELSCRYKKKKKNCEKIKLKKKKASRRKKIEFTKERIRETERKKKKKKRETLVFSAERLFIYVLCV